MKLVPLALALSFAALADEHVLVRPFPGSVPGAHEVKAGQKVSLPSAASDASGKPGKLLELSGRTSRFVWKNPKGHGTQELYDAYVRELSTAGFKPVFACEGKDCGAATAVPPLGKVPATGDAHYALSQLVRRELGDAYAAIQVTPIDTTLLIVETSATPEAQKQVSQEVAAAASKVTADSLGEALLKDGHVALGDILYKPGEVALRPEAAQVVKEIAAFLKKQHQINLYVVGHTDGQGDMKGNLAISRRRAEWLVKELIGQRIEKARLRADGVGPLAPVATNDTEEGRARNRRVELVKQ